MGRVAAKTLFIFAITVSLLEITLQAYAYRTNKKIAAQTAYFEDDKFWTVDAVAGWKNTPNTKGSFKGKHFGGEVTIGPDGNRFNAKQSTFREGYENILFIGDSTTAGFEVNDNDTLPALLEQDLRNRGKKVNVHNLGVRGYGTDQSVQKALPFITKYRPKGIIYLFTGNDMVDNFTIKNGYRKYSKGIFYSEDGKNFEPRNFPVTNQLPVETVSFVFLDKTCRPHFFESHQVLPGGAAVKTVQLLKMVYLYLFGPPLSKEGQERVVGKHRYDIVTATRLMARQSKWWCPDYHRAYFSHQIGLPAEGRAQRKD